MATLKYLLDTNSVIDYIGGKLPQTAENWLDSVIDDEVATSSINRMEILGFAFPTPADKLPFEELLQTITVIPLTEAIGSKTIGLRENIKIKLPDAIIAATALVHNLTLLSRNLKDFSRIPNLNVIDLHTI